MKTTFNITLVAGFIAAFFENEGLFMAVVPAFLLMGVTVLITYTIEKMRKYERSVNTELATKKYIDSKITK